MTRSSGQCRVLFKGTVAKELDHSNSNEDKYAISDDEKCVALCDGASESYDSALWAEILARHAVDHLAVPRSNQGYVKWLKSAIRDYGCQAAPRSSLEWNHQAAYDRGSFATLLTVQVTDSGFEIIAIGDSIAVMVCSETIRRSFPYAQSKDFDKNPHCLSTVLAKNTTPFFRKVLGTLVATSEDHPTPCSVKWPFPKDNSWRLLCLTDAIGEWLLREDDHRGQRLSSLLKIHTSEELIRLVTDRRRDDMLRTDDSTLIVIGPDDVITDA